MSTAIAAAGKTEEELRKEIDELQQCEAEGGELPGEVRRADNVAKGKDLAVENANAGQGEMMPSNLPRWDGNQRVPKMDFDTPSAEHVPLLPKNEEPSLLSGNKRKLDQLCGTSELSRNSGHDIYPGEMFGLDTSANQADRHSGCHFPSESPVLEDYSSEIDFGAGTSGDVTPQIPHHNSQYFGVSRCVVTNGHSSQHSIVSDPASGGELYHGKKVQKTQLHYDLYPPPTRPEDEPMEKRGRNMTRLSPIVHESARRPWLQACPDASSLNLRRAESDIGAALRLHYRGDAVWDDVCIATRTSLWEEIRMRYRWHSAHERGIMDTWENLCRKKFVRMMNSVKDIYLEGLREETPTFWRAKWMEPAYFYICRKRWDSTKEVEKCRKKAQNRGVVFGENGISLRKAPRTHGGTKRRTGNATQMKMESTSSTSLKGVKRLIEQPIQPPSKLPPVIPQNRIVNRKKDVEPMEEVRANSEVNVQMVREDGAPIVFPKVEERPIDEPSCNLHTGNEATLQLDPINEGDNTIDPSLGAPCAGDVTHDKMRRLSQAAVLSYAGFTSQQGHISPPRPRVRSQADPLVEIEELKREFKVLKKTCNAMNKKMTKCMRILSKLAKTQKDPPPGTLSG